MHLALRLGKTLRQLRAEMDCPEFTQWLAFFELEGEPQAGQSDEDRAITEEANAASMEIMFNNLTRASP